MIDFCVVVVLQYVLGVVHDVQKCRIELLGFMQEQWVLTPITENTSPVSGGLHLSTATVSHLPTNEYQQAKRGEKLAISRTRRSLLLWSIQCSIET
jgi:hypothetical protein